MAAESKADIATSITTNIKSGGNPSLTTGANTRTVLGELNDSTLNLVDGGLVIKAETGYDSSITPTSDYSFATKKFVEDASQLKVDEIVYSPAVTPDIDNYNVFSQTLMAGGTTISNPIGTPSRFEEILFSFYSDSIAQTITWGSDFFASNITIPTTTVINQWLLVTYRYYSELDRWGCVGVNYSSWGSTYTADETTLTLVGSQFRIKGTYQGQSSIVTTGTLTSGATGSGFTLNFGTSTLSGSITTANTDAKIKGAVAAVSGNIVLGNGTANTVADLNEFNYASNQLNISKSNAGVLGINVTNSSSSSAAYAKAGFTNNSGRQLEVGVTSSSNNYYGIITGNQSYIYGFRDISVVADGGTFAVSGNAGPAILSVNGSFGVVVSSQHSLSIGAGTSPTAFVDIQGSTTSKAAMRLRTGVAPTSPNDGDMWSDGTDLKFRTGGVTKTVMLI